MWRKRKSGTLLMGMQIGASSTEKKKKQGESINKQKWKHLKIQQYCEGKPTNTRTCGQWVCLFFEKYLSGEMITQDPPSPPTTITLLDIYWKDIKRHIQPCVHSVLTIHKNQVVEAT